MKIFCSESSCHTCTPGMQLLQKSAAVVIALSIIGFISVAALNLDAGHWPISGSLGGGLLLLSTALLCYAKHKSLQKQFDEVSDRASEEPIPDLPNPLEDDSIEEIPEDHLKAPAKVPASDKPLPDPNAFDRTSSPSSSITNITDKEGPVSLSPITPYSRQLEESDLLADGSAIGDLAELSSFGSVLAVSYSPLVNPVAAPTPVKRAPPPRLRLSPHIKIDFSRFDEQFLQKVALDSTKAGQPSFIMKDAIQEVAQYINSQRLSPERVVSISMFDRMTSFTQMGTGAIQDGLRDFKKSWLYQILEALQKANYILSFKKATASYVVNLP